MLKSPKRTIPLKRGGHVMEKTERSISMSTVFMGLIFFCNSLQCMTNKKLKNIQHNKFTFPLDPGQKMPEDPFSYLVKLQRQIKKNRAEKKENSFTYSLYSDDLESTHYDDLYDIDEIKRQNHEYFKELTKQEVLKELENEEEYY